MIMSVEGRGSGASSVESVRSGGVTIIRMFIEVIGRGPLPDDIDRDDVEDVLIDVLGADGEVTGAGSGETGWNLDVEVEPDAVHPLQVLKRLAAALVDQDLGWVILRPEHEVDGRTARDLA
ncbi:hypothetical protein [Actinoplanes sp. G11-F43]|uniref:hypothetical protein n=1 Tax=Actinoplanes sp. G11-F43 TaxID=3424130 RepID=UPI003D34A1AA